MLLLLRGATCFTPDRAGRRRLLLGGDAILRMGDTLPSFPRELPVEEAPLAAARTLPGPIDGHAHRTGGGESGPASRVPTAIGVVGTDDLVRTPAESVAVARALVAEGRSA